MASGRLQEAAPLVDAAMRSLETPQGDLTADGPPPHMQRGMPPERGPSPDGQIHGDQVPMLLSSPPAPQPRASAAPAEPAVHVKLVNPFTPAPREQRAAPAAEAPKSGGTPWGLILLGAALIPIGASVWIFRRKAAPVETKPSLTDKYTIGRLITSGGMGEVYEGKDLTLGRKVALKKMLPDLKLDEALRKQFLHEAKTVAKLTHPYIVQIHDCMESGEDVYLVFEFVKGKTLAQILTEKPRLSLKECLKIFSHVCPAIDHAHKNHILHRDLKPANIMIDESGIARVMDFGIALESTRTMTSAGPGHLDASGTLRYMPPEQHYGKSVRASDVYAMGVCLYEMVTGTLPFAAGSVDELIEQKRGRRFPAASALVPGLPKQFDLLVNAALAPDPQDRVGSAPEFLELLEGVAA
jgi:tRNA A-37 threonylcarbamoyl transferase component Bud32